MPKKEQHIEELFREGFENYKPQPSPQLWSSINRKLWWKRFTRFNWNQVNIFYTGIVVVGITSASLLFLKENASEKTISERSVSPGVVTEERNLVESGKEIPAEVKGEKEKGVTEISTEQPVVKETPGAIKQKDRSGGTNSMKEAELAKTEQKTSDKGIKKQGLQPDITRSAPTSLMAYFIPSEFSGCAPLQVNFTNLSSENTSSSWSFGDGGESSEKNPGYIFDEPGEYIVNLTVSNESNEISSYSQAITVFALPELNFSAEVQETNESGIPVYFYNYTKGAIEYDWIFGDGGHSTDSDPSWIYDEPGDYTVRLLAISSEGCTDSMLLTDIFTESEPDVLLPNAFSPNTFGPTGGYYNPKDNNNDVFHPWFSETPVEYQLRVFNRKGNLLFESSDINIGWDGYYQQILQPQGVYVYKVRARFKNGKTVVKMGDITLFHEIQ